MKYAPTVAAFALVAMFPAEPALAQASEAVMKSCRQQVNKVIGSGNASRERGKGQRREAMIDQCVRNGGKM